MEFKRLRELKIQGDFRSRELSLFPIFPVGASLVFPAGRRHHKGLRVTGPPLSLGVANPSEESASLGDSLSHFLSTQSWREITIPRAVSAGRPRLSFQT